jgi:hypothetical protein
LGSNNAILAEFPSPVLVSISAQSEVSARGREKIKKSSDPSSNAVQIPETSATADDDSEDRAQRVLWLRALFSFGEQR